MGGVGSGGANGGPQYSPTNVNGLGGNGQSGMSTDYTGFSYGKNKEINEQRQAAPIAPSASPRMVPAAPPESAPIIPLDAPTQNPNQPVTAGGALGAGPGEEVLQLPAAPPGQAVNSGTDALRAMYLRDPNNEDLRRMIEYVDRTGVTS